MGRTVKEQGVEKMQADAGLIDARGLIGDGLKEKGDFVSKGGAKLPE